MEDRISQLREEAMAESIEIVRYDPGWPVHFESERERIAQALGDLAIRIDHTGSTAVPGLGGKPTIDIQVSVERLHPLSVYGPALSELCYEHLPHPDDAICPFFYRPAGGPHTHHVHVVAAKGDEERRVLAFRDYLRDHRSIAREYERLKRGLAPHYSAAEFSSRQAYADAKGEFISRITRLAFSQDHPCEG